MCIGTDYIWNFIALSKGNLILNCKQPGESNVCNGEETTTEEPTITTEEVNTTTEHQAILTNSKSTQDTTFPIGGSYINI